MRYLIDTSVLARSLDANHPDRTAAADAVDRLVADGRGVFLVPQVLYEWWTVATRPQSVNGLGMIAADAALALAALEATHPMLDDPPLLYAAWRQLVLHHGVLGKQTHDARLAAAMQVHGLTHLLTFNAQHFARYPFLTVHTPADVLAAP